MNDSILGGLAQNNPYLDQRSYAQARYEQERYQHMMMQQQIAMMGSLPPEPRDNPVLLLLSS